MAGDAATRGSASADADRGVLYPSRLPEFHRLDPPARLAPLVRWFWIPEWSLAPGAVSRQEVLPFPACNLVVEPEGVSLVGPPTRRSERDLRGRGWAVGALLRPAAVPALCAEPAALQDLSAPVAAEALHARVAAAMSTRDDSAAPGGAHRTRAAAALAAWLTEHVPEPDAEGRLANRLAELLFDPGITRVDQLAVPLHASTRTLQRVATKHFGLSIGSMIRRRRLQEAAARLRGADGAADAPQSPPGLAALAHELGYTDHAHFSTEFKAVLGLTPSAYRAQFRGPEDSRLRP